MDKSNLYVQKYGLLTLCRQKAINQLINKHHHSGCRHLRGRVDDIRDRTPWGIVFELKHKLTNLV
jgi:hypothetical protein